MKKTSLALPTTLFFITASILISLLVSLHITYKGWEKDNELVEEELSDAIIKFANEYCGISNTEVSDINFLVHLRSSGGSWTVRTTHPIHTYFSGHYANQTIFLGEHKCIPSNRIFILNREKREFTESQSNELPEDWKGYSGQITGWAEEIHKFVIRLLLILLIIALSIYIYIIIRRKGIQNV